MPKFGDHPVAGLTLAEVLEANRGLLKAKARRFGVRNEDVEDILQDTFLIVSRLELPSQLLVRIPLIPGSSVPPEISSALTGLLAVYIRFASLRHRRHKQRVREVPMDSAMHLADPVAHTMAELLTNLFPDDQVVVYGDAFDVEHVCDLIYERAGLTDIEKVWARRSNEETAGSALAADLAVSPSTITRAKKRALGKIHHFIATGRRADTTNTRQAKCN